MAKIIGITGLAGAGKDTFALELQRQLIGAFGKEVRICSFAEPIRSISAEVGLDPFDRGKKETKHAMSPDEFCDKVYEAIEKVLIERMPEDDRSMLYAYTIEACDKFIIDRDATYPTMHISPREFMQILGTEGGQQVRQTLWVDLARLLWQAFPGYVLVTDTRFAHEVKVVDHLLCVVRPGVAPVNDHPSEQLARKLTMGLRPASVPLNRLHYVENNGTLDDIPELAYRVGAIITL